MLSHSDFIVAYKLDKVALMYNTKKAAQFFCESFPNHSLRGFMKKFIKIYKSNAFIYLAGGICLLSPFKLMIIFVLLFAAFQYAFEKAIRKYIEENMVLDLEFYNKIIEQKIVHLELNN